MALISGAAAATAATMLSFPGWRGHLLVLNNGPVAVSTISWWQAGASVISGFCTGYR
jgi:hypothetical protein